MRVLVTGGAGFLGSHVCEHYAKLGHEVVAFDNLTKHELTRTGYDAVAARRHIVALLESWGVQLRIFSITDMEHVMDAVSRTDFTVNCAAQPAMTMCGIISAKSTGLSPADTCRSTAAAQSPSRRCCCGWPCCENSPASSGSSRSSTVTA